MEKVKELRLDYCDECMQMTNHLDDECQKCKTKENETSHYENYDDEDEEYHRNNHRRKRGDFDDEEY